MTVTRFPSSTRDLPSTSSSAAKWLCPESVRHNRDVGRVRLILFRKKSAPATGRDAEDAEEIRRNTSAAQSFRLVRSRQTHPAQIVDGNTFECAALFRDLLELGQGERESFGVGARVEL